MIKDYLNKYAYFLFRKELMLIVALIPSGSFLCKNTNFSSFFFSSSSVWWILGPSRNVWLSWKHPTSYQERGKTSRARWGKLWSTVLKSFSTFSWLLWNTTHTHTKKKRGLLEHSASFSAALGCLRAPPDFSVWVEYSTSFNSKHTIVFAVREISFFKKNR